MARSVIGTTDWSPTETDLIRAFVIVEKKKDARFRKKQSFLFTCHKRTMAHACGKKESVAM